MGTYELKLVPANLKNLWWCDSRSLPYDYYHPLYRSLRVQWFPRLKTFRVFRTVIMGPMYDDKYCEALALKIKYGKGKEFATFAEAEAFWKAIMLDPTRVSECYTGPTATLSQPVTYRMENAGC